MHLQGMSLKDARNLFFRHVDSVIFQEHEIRSLQSLLSDYKRIVSDYGYPVGEIKSAYIKELLVAEYNGDIGFQKRCEKNMSEWVYDTKGGGDYIQCAVMCLGISDEQLIRTVASRISQEMKNTPSIPWPPNIEELERSEELSPLLMNLLTCMKQPSRSSLDISPATLSLAALVTYHATGKRTATAINLGMNVHGMTRSRNLVDILHKSRVCISYSDIQLLYDYWALQDAESSSTCPQEIADDKPAIVIIDNDDFKIYTLTGSAAAAHRTNVMFLQPAEYENTEENRVPTVIKKNDIVQKLKQKCEEMTHVEQYKCPAGASNEPPIRTRQALPVNSTTSQRMRSVVHALSRTDEDYQRPDPGNQTVPAYSGFQSRLQSQMARSKPYYHATYPEPPSKSVVYDIMRKLLEAMQRKNIPFIFLVGDMPTYKTIVQIKAENPELFRNIIPVIGTFHQQMSYFHAIYKRFKGSGMADTLVSAGVIVGGSVDQALKGTHYRRGVRCILLWREVLIHLRIQVIMENKTLSDTAKQALRVLRSPLEHTQNTCAEAYSELESLQEIKDIVEAAYEKPGTDMGDFWSSFLEMSDPLVQNIHSCHAQSYTEYKSSTYEMLPGLIAYDNLEYARWLPDFWAMLSGLPEEHSEFFSQHFSQSMTGLPYSGQALDLWIETTMNLNSKLKQGWLNLLHIEKQLFTTIRNVNNVARIKATVEQNLKCVRKNSQHVDCQPARMRKDEQAVHDIEACLLECEANPYDASHPELRSIQSGIKAPPELLIDTSVALFEGRNQVETFMEERVYAKNHNIKDRMKKNKRKNFDNIQTPTPSSKALSQSQMESAGLAAVIELAEGTGALTLEHILEHRVTDECLSLYNVDGSMRKTTKCKLLDYFNLQPVQYRITQYASIVDMGLIWRLATPTADDREKKRRDGVEYKWKDYLEKIVNLIELRHSGAELIIIINDPYKLPFSIKDDEHNRRLEGHTGAGNVFPKPHDKFPAPSEFNSFLCYSGNKVRLQDLVKTSLKQSARADCIIYCVDGESTNLGTGVNSDFHFDFNHAEADTMILTAYAQLRDQNYTHPVVIDSQDTDVYSQSADVSHQIPGQLCMKRKQYLVDCEAMLTEEVSKVIIAAHVISGGDHTSGLYSHGKKTVMKKLSSDAEAIELLENVGDSPELSDEVAHNMEEFVLTKLYGCVAGITCSEARAMKWRMQKKKNTMYLPPDTESLYYHLQRTNYITYCQRHVNLIQHPSPLSHGWELVNGLCRPVRYRLSALPRNVPWLPGSDSETDEDEQTDYGESDSSHEEEL